MVNINIEKSIEEFYKYVNKYNIENEDVKRKINHSIRVMKICKKIAKEIGLNEEEVKLAMLIGLLHDIGRFKQVEQYNTFKDDLSIDHGDYGKEILIKNRYLSNYIQTTNYDNIILKAIQNHNKYKIEDNLNKEELIYCKIIRDADKIDILYEGTKEFWDKEGAIKEIENSAISSIIEKKAKKLELIEHKIVTKPADEVIKVICLTFDINYKITFNILKEEQYIKKIIERFNFKTEEIAIKVENIKNIISKYVIEKSK